MIKRSTFFGTIAIILSSLAAHAEDPVTPVRVKPPVYPAANGSGAKTLDWQDEWGSIHMNSLADGLNDPGTISNKSKEMRVDCGRYYDGDPTKRTICDDMKDVLHVSDLPKPIADNGIKDDIKNSVNNCMAKPISNWAKNHSYSYSKDYVCKNQYPPIKDDPKTIVYIPYWDARGNDDRADVGNYHGCQQQVINNCVRDVHDCVFDAGEISKTGKPFLDYVNQKADFNKGYEHPATHVFSPEEVADLGGRGQSLPLEYYSYTKATEFSDESPKVKVVPAGGIVFWTGKCPPPDADKTCYTYKTMTKSRIALSPTNPTGAADRVPGTPVKKISTHDPDLARIQAYWVDTKGKNDKPEKFIIVDPSRFFDLALYAKGGDYDVGYDVRDNTGRSTQGNLAPNETCPILGSTGYQGICDPTGKAGCNLPIYQVGAETMFKAVDNPPEGRPDGNYYYHDYHIAWSGYVKKWAQISVAEYEKNIEPRKAAYFHGKTELNDNPILMLTRADEYCDDKLERVSSYENFMKTGKAGDADMDCIQYLQYQVVNQDTGEYAWRDLFDPLDMMESQEGSIEQRIANDRLQLYNIDKDGRNIATEPVAGTGSDKYVGDGTHTGFLQFADVDRKYHDAKQNKDLPAVYKSNYFASFAVDPVTGRQIAGGAVNQGGKLTPGEALRIGKDGKQDTSGGVGLISDPGTLNTVRMREMTQVGGDTVPCVTINYPPKYEKQLFIPTNTQAEFQAFVDAANNAKAANSTDVNEVVVKKCAANFVKNTDAGTLAGLDAITKVDGTKTWTGVKSCNALADESKPQCNQTKMIYARRYCQLETGAIDACTACEGADIDDPDGSFHFTPAMVDGEIRRDPSRPNNSKCIMAASCFAKGNDQCPGADTSGGHVFCLSPETKITMADGSQKAIGQIKAGEKVMSFNSKMTRQHQLQTSTVKAVAITKDQTIMKVNDLKITPKHKMILASGRAVAASELKVGDSLLREDGVAVPVTSIERNVASITVYNLVLEKGADGYIAGGMRVISYPDLKLKAPNVELKAKTENVEKSVRKISAR